MTKTGEAARPSLTLEPESLLDRAVEYQKPIIVGVIALALAIGGGWMWKRSAEIKETRAAAAFATAESAFGAGNVQLAKPELEKVSTRYAGTAAGTQAAMLLAQIAFDEGKHADGISKLEAALPSAPAALRAGVSALIGGGQEAAGKSAEAATAFERAATEATFDQDREMYRMEAARNHVVAGNVTGAKAIYESIASRENSAFAGEAKVRLGELTTKA